jgi:hypothetical protein
VVRGKDGELIGDLYQRTLPQRYHNYKVSQSQYIEVTLKIRVTYHNCRKQSSSCVAMRGRALLPPWAGEFKGRQNGLKKYINKKNLISCAREILNNRTM